MPIDGLPVGPSGSTANPCPASSHSQPVADCRQCGGRPVTCAWPYAPSFRVPDDPGCGHMRASTISICDKGAKYCLNELSCHKEII